MPFGFVAQGSQRLEDAAKTERDKLVVRVLADTGIRVGELATLRPTDLIACKAVTST